MLKGPFRLLPALLLLGFTHLAHTQDCLVSTSPPPILATYPGVTDSKAQMDKGVYVATVDNGDQILVQFGTCELMLRGHYLIREPINPPALKQLLKRLISALVPAQTDLQSIQQQIDAVASLEPGQSMVLKGATDQHRITVSPADSPLFAAAIHYEWLPPQH